MSVCDQRFHTLYGVVGTTIPTPCHFVPDHHRLSVRFGLVGGGIIVFKWVPCCALFLDGVGLMKLAMRLLYCVVYLRDKISHLLLPITRDLQRLPGTFVFRRAFAGTPQVGDHFREWIWIVFHVYGTGGEGECYCLSVPRTCTMCLN